jgi:phage baseplate assembly protein W
MLTVPGERMMEPLFGVGLSKFLFEQHNTAVYANIAARTKSQVRKYMPFVSIDNMTFYGPLGVWDSVRGTVDDRLVVDADPNKLQIKISLTIKPLARSTTLKLNL